MDYDPAGADGLRADMERIVSTEEAGGWFLDRTHYDSMHPSVVQSTCRATPAARQLLADRLESEMAVAGDPRTMFEANGHQTNGAIDHALHLERMHTALVRANAEPCPFWITAEAGFLGRQTDRRRITLNAETGGLVAFRWSNDKVTFGAGPSIRILFAQAFDHVTFLVGPELSGEAMLRADDSSKVVIDYFPAIPVVVRIRYVNWIYSVETGVMSLLESDDTRLTFGVRAGFGIGFMTLRNRWFIPWAGISAYQEHYFPGAGRSAQEFFRGGFRVGIIYDP
jgi:hypothetical protein